MFVQAQGVPRAALRLVEACISCVFVRRLALSTYQVDIEFPTGAVIRRLLITEDIVASMGEQAWIVARTNASVDAGSIARELNAALRVRRVGTPWTDDRVLAVALRAKAGGSGIRHSDHRRLARSAGGDVTKDNARPGRRRTKRAPSDSPAAALTSTNNLASITLEELFVKVGATREVVLGLALIGRLGHVQPHENGTVRMSPSDRDLHREFPEYARTMVAQLAGWPLEDTVRRNEVREKFGDTVAARAEARAHVVDARGWGYVRWSHVEPEKDQSPIVAALRDAPAPMTLLDRRYWLPKSEALKKARVPWATLQHHAPLLDVHWRGEVRPYAWIGPDVLARIDRAALREAAQDLARADLGVDDFHQRRALIAHFNERHAFLTEGAWMKAVKSGAIVEVECYGTTVDRRVPMKFAHVPPHIYNGDEQDLRDWLAGRGRGTAIVR